MRSRLIWNANAGVHPFVDRSSTGSAIGVRPFSSTTNQAAHKRGGSAYVGRTPTQPWLVSAKLFRKFRDDAARIWWQDGRQQKFVVGQAGAKPPDAFTDRFVTELAGRQN
jgi:hypothetical protein